MQNEGVSLVSAYFAIRSVQILISRGVVNSESYTGHRFPAFTYYVKTLSCTIGRRSTPGNRDDLVPVHVDIDLGPLKSVSRLHARIEFDEDRDGFVICVLGRNGAWVGGDWVKSGAKVLLGPKLVCVASVSRLHRLMTCATAVEQLSKLLLVRSNFWSPPLLQPPQHRHQWPQLAVPKPNQILARRTKMRLLYLSMTWMPEYSLPFRSRSSPSRRRQPLPLAQIQRGMRLRRLKFVYLFAWQPLR
jgi:FHA domain